MFAALSLAPEFFRGKINLAIMLAPVARVDGALSKTIQEMATNYNAVSLAESIGPEIFPNP
jgi:hypothetical protein